MADLIEATIIFKTKELYEELFRYMHYKSLTGNLLPDVVPCDLVCLAVIKSVEDGEKIVISKSKKE